MEISALLSTVTYRFGFVAFDCINYLKALQFHFLQSQPWNKIYRLPTTVRVSLSLFSSQFILLQTHLVVDGRPCRTYLCFWPVWWTQVRGLVETWDTACRRSPRHGAGFAGPGSFREPWSDENFRHPGYSEGPDRTHPLNLEKWRGGLDWRQWQLKSKDRDN